MRPAISRAAPRRARTSFEPYHRAPSRFAGNGKRKLRVRGAQLCPLGALARDLALVDFPTRSGIAGLAGIGDDRSVDHVARGAGNDGGNRAAAVGGRAKPGRRCSGHEAGAPAAGQARALRVHRLDELGLLGRAGGELGVERAGVAEAAP